MTEFTNVQEINEPTFERPDISWIKRVINEADNDDVFVKVCANNERFWAQVESVEGGHILCTVANTLIHDHEFDFEDPIVVEFDNIYDVYVGEGAHGEEGEENLRYFHGECNKVEAKKERMKAFLIDPQKEAITEVDYDGTLQHMYELIDCDCVCTCRINQAGDTIFLDDNGLYNKDHFFRYDTYPNPLAGKGLVLGTNYAGESISPKEVTREHLNYAIDFINRDIAIEMGIAVDEQNAEIARHDDRYITLGPIADILRDSE